MDELCQLLRKYKLYCVKLLKKVGKIKPLIEGYYEFKDGHRV